MQPLDDLKEELKREVHRLATLWRTRFEGGYGIVAKQRNTMNQSVNQ
jgi:hypothetical protein